MIGLQPRLQDDGADPGATIRAVADIIASRPAAHWKQAFDGVDACATLVSDLESALAEVHFQERGIFSGQTELPDGTPIAALPVPIASCFRSGATGNAPELGSHRKPGDIR